MELAYSDEQAMFADIVERLLAARYSFEHRQRIAASATGIDGDLWTALAELGCFGLPIPPDSGGFGGSMIDVGILMEAIGRHLVVEPVLASAVLGGRLAASVGAVELIEPMIAGQMILSFVDGADSIVVEGGNLSGRATLVPGGAQTDTLLVSANDALYAVPKNAPGLSIQAVRLLDGTRGGDLEFFNVPGKLLSENASGEIDRIRNEAVVASGFEALGSMSAALRQTSDYMKERRQFGRALAEFQVVKHRVAEMAVAVEEARASTLLAALVLDGGATGLAAMRAVSGMKVRVADCARIVAQGAVQLHGGMGVSEELPIASHFRKLLAFETIFGTVADHLGRYADAVIPAGLYRESAVLVEAG